MNVIMNEQPAVSELRVFLKCYKEGGKLRVKIESNGFNQSANCQFPKDIRAEGHPYGIVHPSQISIAVRGSQRFFYRVTKPIRIETDTAVPDIGRVFNGEKPNKVYEDVDDDDCVVCLTNPKKYILVPCGHYQYCEDCVALLQKCPLCRSHITNKITKAQMD